jgi:hypothetical protein
MGAHDALEPVGPCPECGGLDVWDCTCGDERPTMNADTSRDEEMPEGWKWDAFHKEWKRNVPCAELYVAPTSQGRWHTPIVEGEYATPAEAARAAERAAARMLAEGLAALPLDEEALEAATARVEETFPYPLTRYVTEEIVRTYHRIAGGTYAK